MSSYSTKVQGQHALSFIMHYAGTRMHSRKLMIVWANARRYERTRFASAAVSKREQAISANESMVACSGD